MSKFAKSFSSHHVFGSKVAIAIVSGRPKTMIWCGFERLLNHGVGLRENCSSLCMLAPFQPQLSDWRTMKDPCPPLSSSSWKLSNLMITLFNQTDQTKLEVIRAGHMSHFCVGLFCAPAEEHRVLRETAAPDSPKGLGIPLNASFQVLWSSWDAVWWIWESHELIYGWYKFHWYKS